MENRTIKDSQIIASSVYSNKFAQDARLNSDSGWCANFFNRKQFIQVVLFLLNNNIILFSIQGFFFAKYYCAAFNVAELSIAPVRQFHETIVKLLVKTKFSAVFRFLTPNLFAMRLVKMLKNSQFLTVN